MLISPFLLHYPDGSVAIAIKKEQKPDAFLLSCPKGNTYWVSLNFSSEVVPVQEAQKRARAIKIEHSRCSLLPLFALWYLFSNYQKVNILLHNLGLNPIPKGYFWVKPQNKHFFLINFKDEEETKHSLCLPSDKKAMIIAGIPVPLSLKTLPNQQPAKPSVIAKEQKKEVGKTRVLPHPKESPKLRPMRQNKK